MSSKLTFWLSLLALMSTTGCGFFVQMNAPRVVPPNPVAVVVVDDEKVEGEANPFADAVVVAEAGEGGHAELDASVDVTLDASLRVGLHSGVVEGGVVVEGGGVVEGGAPGSGVEASGADVVGVYGAGVAGVAGVAGAAGADVREASFRHGDDHGELEAGIDLGALAAGGLAVEVDVALRGTPGVAAEELGGGVGVRAAPGPDGRRARQPALAALATEIGLDVDGFRTRLGDLGPLAPRARELEAAAGIRLDTDGRVDVRAELEHVQLPRAGGETHLVVRVRGGALPANARNPVRVHLVIDRSSSMRSVWPEVLASARAVIDQLAPEDEIHIVCYDGSATEVVAVGPVGDGARARAALRRLNVGGGTNIEVGLRMAYDVAVRTPGIAQPLVILLSDGVPNGGAFTADELAPMAGRARASAGVTTTVVGLGNEFDADVLQAIAAAGRGGYHVAHGVEDLGLVLQAEVRAQVRIAARQVEVGVALPEGVELLEGPNELERLGGRMLLKLPQLREGEERRLVFRVRVGARVTRVAHIDARYQGAGGAVSASKDVSVAFGARAERSGGAAMLAVADADLGEALHVAAGHLRDGRAGEAEAALRAHVGRYQGARGSVALQHRTEAVARFATGIAALAPAAGWGPRRELALAMGGLSVRLRR